MQTQDETKYNTTDGSLEIVRAYKQIKNEDRDRATSADDCNTDTMRHTNSGIGSEFSINSNSRDDENHKHLLKML